MPYWYYDKKDLQNTPSFRDGISNDTENRYRKEGARFIIDTGSKMDLGYNTVATGVVYFHRFYMFHSFKTFPRYITACCCLFLAGKVEETPKKCKDIIKVAKSLLTEQKFGTFGEDPKEEVMTLERILLQTIKFDLQVEHPYGYLLKYAKCLKGDKGKLQKMVQMAWTFVNDSLCTTLCLQWEPEVIAVALMFLAGKLSKFEVVDWNGRTPKHTAWWDMFVEDITMDLLEDICHQVLDLYSPQTQASGGDSPPISAKQPKNDKKPPSVTPPASVSPVAATKPVTAAAHTPIKNGADAKLEPPKIEPPLRFPYPYPGLPAYPPVYSAPPPNIPPPPRIPLSGPPPPLYSEPPPAPPGAGAPGPRFPGVVVPPPHYFPPLPGRGPPPPGPPPRPYYPPP
ncbi:cyclin-K-like [Pectinophora gossypiella]|uniref:cyclin-K-like n=1 Tax=Pectinophora gossypiella TaxID=13191 RepID=UPI00214E80A6|nr:cyclin-K-like [Pectinophora gossypiella]